MCREATGAAGAVLFAKDREMGLGGIVSKRLGGPDWSGRMVVKNTECERQILRGRIAGEADGENGGGEKVPHPTLEKCGLGSGFRRHLKNGVVPIVGILHPVPHHARLAKETGRTLR